MLLVMRSSMYTFFDISGAIYVLKKYQNGCGQRCWIVKGINKAPIGYKCNAYYSIGDLKISYFQATQTLIVLVIQFIHL